jgi:DNA-binding response OmpR family regulator
MKSILIVDDEFEITNILRWLFEWNDFKVHTASNGKEALAILASQPVDILVIDVMMPVMDGIELAGLIKSDPTTQSIPLIMMSAGPVEAAEQIADYFFHKPFLFQDLLAQVKTI